MIDLALPEMRAEMARRIEQKYDEASIKLFREGNRNHLGASVIGEPCEAKIWFGWRWIWNHNPGGRMYRLWQRGHREEPFVFDHLRSAGFVVHDRNPEDGKQWRMSAVHGHFGGSCDGLGFLPSDFGYSAGIGFEVKTANEKQFKVARAQGVVKWRPKYARQMDQYGMAFGVRYFVFIVINKNDDDVHVEIYECRPVDATLNLHKAERIILAMSRPPRLSDHPSFAECRYCDFHNHCHKGALPSKNCRSCKYAAPIPNGNWRCGHYNQHPIPNDVIIAGCDNWHPII